MKKKKESWAWMFFALLALGNLGMSSYAAYRCEFWLAVFCFGAFIISWPHSDHI